MMFTGKDGCLDMKLNLNSPTGLESLHSTGLCIAVQCIAAMGSNLDGNTGISWALPVERRGFSLHSHSLNQLKYPWWNSQNCVKSCLLWAWESSVRAYGWAGEQSYLPRCRPGTKDSVQREALGCGLGHTREEDTTSYKPGRAID